MKVNYKEVEVTQLEERGLFEAEFDNLNSLLEDRYFTVFTVNNDNTSNVVYATERLDGGMVPVTEDRDIKELKRVLDCWLKKNISRIEELYAA